MLEDGKLTWDEYTENVNEAGEALYDGRISQSEKWLDRELKYGRISQAEYRAGLDRMRAYTQEYYDKNERKTLQTIASYENTILTVDFSTLNKSNNIDILKQNSLIIYPKSFQRNILHSIAKLQIKMT